MTKYRIGLFLTCALAFTVSACAGAEPAQEHSATSATSAPGPSPTVLMIPRVIVSAGHDSDPGTNWSERLEVEPHGAWECHNCAGDDKTTSGKLNEIQIRDLHSLLNDPTFAEEDMWKRPKPKCEGEWFSTLASRATIVAWQDCPGDGPPRTTAAILRVLTDGTPLVVKAPAA
ncbi:hypothetical protein [Plantactinospora sp. DSM 117369]